MGGEPSGSKMGLRGYRFSLEVLKLNRAYQKWATDFSLSPQPIIHGISVAISVLDIKAISTVADLFLVVASRPSLRRWN
jgi:hypothetical protein